MAGLMSYNLASGSWEDFSSEPGGPELSLDYNLYGPRIIAADGNIFAVSNRHNKQSSVQYDCKFLILHTCPTKSSRHQFEYLL